MNTAISLETDHSRRVSAVTSDSCRRLAAFASLAVIALAAAAPSVTVGDICCNCSSATVSASTGQANLNEPVTITYNASYCRCVGGPCWHPEGNCSLAPVDINVYLEGFGVVHTESVSFPPTNDFNIALPTFTFNYTPVMPGMYTVTAGGTCPTTSDSFQAGCDGTCAGIGQPDGCDECGTIAKPMIMPNKSDNIIRTVCPSDCEAQNPDAKGETVTVDILAGGDTPDCYEITLTTDQAVMALSPPPNKGSWPGTLSVKLQGQIGTGTAKIQVKFYKFDEENQCWLTSQESLTMEAKPDDDCCDPNGQPPALRGTLALIGVPVLGEIQLDDVKVEIRPGTENLLRIPSVIAVHPNGDAEVLLPGRANPVIFQPGGGFLEGWILGGPPGGFLRADFVQLSNIVQGLTYVFESTGVGPDPFRLRQIRRFDASLHSSYVYDAGGRLMEIHVGGAASTTYFDLTYDVMGKLMTITPVVGGASMMERAVTLVYDGDTVVGADGAVCPDCGGERRRFYYDAGGMLTRIADVNDNDLELFEYDMQGRLTLHERLDDDDTLVTVQATEYAMMGSNSVATIHEPVNATQERIRREVYDDSGRLLRIDQYPQLFNSPGTPGGTAYSTVYSYTDESDPESGIDIELTEVTRPDGVTEVTLIKTFAEGLPVFLTETPDEQGWILPTSAYEQTGTQAGDAEITPQIQGATASVMLEVGTSGLYSVGAQLHEAATIMTDDEVCVEFSLDGGTGGFAPAYAVLREGELPPVGSWLETYGSCADYGVAGQEHGGWELEVGTTYAMQMTFAAMAPAVNPADGWGVDGVSLSRFDTSPATYPVAPHESNGMSGQYTWRYLRAADGAVSESEITFALLNEVSSWYRPQYEIDRRGGVTEYAYDDQGLLTHAVGPSAMLLDGGGDVRMEKVYEYDVNNNVTREGRTGPHGALVYTEYQYNALGQLTRQVENADGLPGEQRITDYAYNAFGEQTLTTNPCGDSTETFHGSAGRVEKEVVYASGSSGNVLQETNYQYDADSGRLTRVSRGYDRQSFPIDGADEYAHTDYARDLYGRILVESTPKPGGGTLTRTLDYDYQDQVVEQVNEDGSIERFTYDGLGQVIEQRKEGPGVAALVTQYAYNDLGQLATQTSPGEGATLFEYDGFGRQSAMIHAARIEFSYNSAGAVTRQRVVDTDSGATLQDTVMDYDALGRQIRKRDRLMDGVDGPDDPVQMLAYGPSGKLDALIWKADGNLDVENAQAGDRVRSSEYDALGREIAAENGEGERTEFTYDLCGRMLTRTVDPANLDLTTTFEYDAMGRATRETDPATHYQRTRYDSFDNEIEQTAHDGTTGDVLSKLIQEYDLGERLVRNARLADPTQSIINPSLDFVEDNAYDALGRLTSVVRSVGGGTRAVQFSYDGIGRRTQVTLPSNPGANYAAFTYEPGTGLLVSRTDHSDLGDRLADFSYDDYGRRTQETISGGATADRTKVTEYDAMGRVTRITHADGAAEWRTFDLAGRAIRTMEDADGLQKETLWGFSRLNQSVSVQALDDDGPDQTTYYAFDSEGRVTQTIASDGRTMTVLYDTAGRITGQTDPRGFGIDYLRDARGQLVGRVIDDAGYDAYFINETYTYDAMGRPVSFRSDADNRVEYAYDALSYRTQEVQVVDGVSKTVDIGRNQLGERTSITIPGGPLLTYGYDAAGMISSIERGGTPVVYYDYSGAFPIRRDVSAGAENIRTEWGYDGQWRVDSVSNRATTAGTDLFVFDYALNAFNAPESQTRSGAGGSSSTSYEYDSLRRLTSAAHGGPLAGVEEFEYDVLSNRRSYRDRHTGPGDPAETYTHDAGNKYTQVGAAGLGYDAAGNLTLDEAGYQYEYDFANRMTTIRDPGGSIVAEYQYDVLGRRVETAIDGTVTRYYYDDEENVLAEFDGSDQLLRYYVHGRSGRDEHALVHDTGLARSGVDADYVYALQNNMTVAGLVDASGAIVESYEYDAYGAVTINGRLRGDVNGDGAVDLQDYAAFQLCLGGSLPGPCSPMDLDGDMDVDLDDYAALAACQAGPGTSFSGCVESDAPGSINRYFFTGRRLDFVDGGALEIQYNRNRYYAPSLGRFYSVDPLGIAESPNLYDYAMSRPTALRDPEGLSSGPVKAVVVKTPWLDVEVGKGCVKINKSWDKNFPPKYFAGGKVKVYYGFSFQVGGEVCKNCCKKGSQMPGTEVYDIRATFEAKVTGGVDFRPWGVYVGIGWPFYINIDVWAGLKFGGSLTGGGKGFIGSDKCYGRNLTGEFCVVGSVTGSISGGAEILVTDAFKLPGDEGYELFKLGATVNGSLTVELTKCYNCRGSCSWKPTKVCVKGRAWTQLQFLTKLGTFQKELELGSFDTCD